MEKTTAKILVMFFGSLLVLLLTHEIYTLVLSITDILSSVEFNQVENGFYESIVLAVSAKTIKSSQPILLETSCNCSVELHNTDVNSRKCRIFSAPFPSDPNYIIKTILTNSTYLSASAIEGPRDFGKGEFMRMTCSTEDYANFGILILPLTFDRTFELLSHTDTAVQFFDTHFRTRPQRILSGGQNILITMSSLIMQDQKGFVGPEQKYLNTHISTTASGDERLTEFILTWQTPIYVLVKRFKLGNYLQILKLLATFFLSIELVFAMYGRFRKNKIGDGPTVSRNIQAVSCPPTKKVCDQQSQGIVTISNCEQLNNY